MTILINIQDAHGDTPLHDAISTEAKEIIEILTNCPQVRFDVANERGFNCLNHAALKGNCL